MPSEADTAPTLVTSTPLDILRDLKVAVKDMQEKQRLSDDLLNYAWTIIANAGVNVKDEGFGWDREADDWHLAAITWRDRYHELIRG